MELDQIKFLLCCLTLCRFPESLQNTGSCRRWFELFPLKSFTSVHREKGNIRKKKVSGVHEVNKDSSEYLTFRIKTLKSFWVGEGQTKKL